MARKHRDSRTVALESGGKITINLHFSNFDLSDRDREFVAYLIDMTRDYEASTAEKPEKPPKKRRSRAAEEVETEAAIAIEP